MKKAIFVYVILQVTATTWLVGAAEPLSEKDVATWMKVQNALHPDDPPLTMQGLKLSAQSGTTYVEPKSFTS